MLLVLELYFYLGHISATFGHRSQTKSPLEYFSRSRRNITVVMSSTEYSGFQPQSFRASLSSMLFGQESAMACRKSGSKVVLNSGTYFTILSWSSRGVNENAVRLYVRLCRLAWSASRRSSVALMTSGMNIMGIAESSRRKHL